MSVKVTKEPPLKESKFCPSAFTLTFVVEVVGLDVWHDCNEGWLDLGPPVHGVKLSYQLYPGQTFEVNVVIWPHVAKVSCGIEYNWVRTWLFLERRWLSFSICHAFPVRVMNLHKFEASVVPSFVAANAKSEYATELYLPRLEFGERRQFARVIEKGPPLKKYIEDMIWSLVVNFIPIAIVDGPFNIPHPVKEIRHQDAVLCQVRDVILNRQVVVKEEGEKEKKTEVQQTVKNKNNSAKSIKNVKSNTNRTTYGLQLSGDWILAGIGRVTPFATKGYCPEELGNVIALISSINLPAQDDFPTFFVNVGNITDVPTEHLKKNRFTHIYTRWMISEEEWQSEQQSLQTKHPSTEVNFNDHHSVPLPSAIASDLMATFLDTPFQVEVRGIRVPPPPKEKNILFGYEKADRDCDMIVPPPIPKQDVDILIARTKIDARALTKINGFVKGEFPLYPPETSLVPLGREEVCTNDINAVRAKVKPDLFIQPGVILEAQMTIEVSLGLVGCKPKQHSQRYSRLYCLVSDVKATMALLRQITELNESINKQIEDKAGLLTGFALDTGDQVMFYVEGPKEGQILRVWEQTEDFYPTMKPVFSTAAKYSCRLYPELLLAAMPFNILKMFVPLSIVLSLTPVYVRPALPLPTRAAVLKLGRLISSKFKSAPCCNAMPTAMEMKSFRLELCVGPRPPPFYGVPRILLDNFVEKRESASKINWKPKLQKCSDDRKH